MLKIIILLETRRRYRAREESKEREARLFDCLTVSSSLFFIYLSKNAIILCTFSCIILAELRYILATPELRSRNLTETAMSTTVDQSPPPHVFALPQDPRSYSDSGTPYFDYWVNKYERVSIHNRWDDTIMLFNVISYIKDIVRTWFENHETELTSWDACKVK